MQGMMNTNGEIVTHCSNCGMAWDEHQWINEDLKPSFAGPLLTTGGVFLLPKCPEALEWPEVIDEACPTEKIV